MVCSTLVIKSLNIYMNLKLINFIKNMFENNYMKNITTKMHKQLLVKYQFNKYVK